MNGGLDRDGRPVSLATPVIAVQRGRVCGQRIVSGTYLPTNLHYPVPLPFLYGRKFSDTIGRLQAVLFDIFLLIFFFSGAADARSLAQVLTQLITFREATNSSVEAPRFHLGPVPRSILLEGSLDLP